jgi:DedD protein
MDEALMRRLIGAATLLLVAFVLAALLPDPESPEGEGAVVAYDLRTGLPIGPAEPVPAPVEHPPTLKPVEKLEPRAAESALAPAATPPLPRPALKVDESLGQPGGWFVQVGSFSSQANARGALQTLFGMGLPTVIQSVAVGKVLWYRVRVGPYPAEGAALAVLAQVRKKGFTTAKLVKPEAAAKGN